jgi:hypothetical protein
MAGLRKRFVFADRGLVLTVEESLELHSGSTDQGRFVTGKLKPVAVIVNEPSRSYAINLEPNVGDLT